MKSKITPMKEILRFSAYDSVDRSVDFSVWNLWDSVRLSVSYSISYSIRDSFRDFDEA